MHSTLRSPSPRTASVLLVCPAEECDFGDVIARLAQLAEGGEVRLDRVRSSDFAAALCGIGPDLAVICQSWSDEFPRRQIEALASGWPLTRVICCCGPWCDSDGRTRGHWPLGWRVPADQAVTRLEHEMQVLKGIAPPLPATATRDEAFAYDHLSDLPTEAVHGALTESIEVVVCSPDRDFADTLTDACRSAGWSASRRSLPDAQAVPPQAGGLRIIVWDADPIPPLDQLDGRAELRHRLEALRRLASDAPIIAVTGYNRSELTTALFDAGVAAVHPRLATRSQLCATLHRVAATDLCSHAST